MAHRAGCVITDMKGEPLKFEDTIDKEYSIVCTANRAIHERVIEALKKS